MSDVNILLKNYKHLVSLHKWIRGMKEKGEQLPTTQDELVYRFKKEHPVSKSFLKFELKRPRYSKKMSRQRIKWGVKKVL